MSAMNRHLPPAWLHIALSLLAPAALTVGILFGLNWLCRKFGWPDLLGIGPFVIASASGIAAHAAIRYLLPVRCSLCGGPARYHDGSPITYQCNKCGHTQSGWFSSTDQAP